MKKDYLRKSLLILFVFSLKSILAQTKELVFLETSDNLLEYFRLISREEFNEKKLNGGLKINDVFADYKHYSKKLKLVEILEDINSDMFEIYSNDSIKIKGKNEDVLLRTYISDIDDRDYQIVESVSEYHGHYFFLISGYETWYSIVVDIDDEEVYVFLDVPVLINKNEFVIVSHYYGEGVFSYFNSETDKGLWFNLSNFDIKDYYLQDGKIFFQFVSNEDNSQSYFYSLSYKD
jgi:hypothetical protein